jgi:hypothetical protein
MFTKLTTKTMEYSKGKIRVEPSPYAHLGRVKITQRNKQLGANGEPIKTVGADGSVKYVTSENDVIELVTLPGTYKNICPMNKRGGVITGLEEMVPNKYQDDKVYKPSASKDFNWKDILAKQPFVRLQHILEYEHGVRYNYYTGNFRIPNDRFLTESELSDISYFANPANCSVKMDNNVKVLDMDSPTDELAYYMLKARKDVAKSYSDLENDKGGKRWVLVDDKEKVKSTATSRIKKDKAAAHLLELFELNSDDIFDMASVCGRVDIVTKEDAYVFIGNFMEQGETNLNFFEAHYKMWKDIPTRQEFANLAKLEKYVKAGIMSKNNNKYYYNHRNPDTGATETFEWTNAINCVKSFLMAPEFKEYSQYVDSLYARYK